MPPAGGFPGRTSPVTPPKYAQQGNISKVEISRLSGIAVGQFQRIFQGVSRIAGGTGNAASSLGSLSAKIKQFSFAALTAATGLGAAMLSTQQHFSPATYHMFQLRLGDLAAVVGGILHPAFESLSSAVYSTSKFLLNLSPALKGLINFAAELSVPVVLLSVALPGLSWAIRGVWRGVVAAISGINAATASIGGIQGFVSGGAGVIGGIGSAVVGGTAAYALGGNSGQIAGAALGTAALTAAASGGIATGVGMATGSALLATLAPWALAIVGTAAIGDALFNKGRGAEWVGKQVGIGATDHSPAGRDAARQVTTLNSVLEAGQMFRAQSLMNSQNIGVGEMLAERDKDLNTPVGSTLNETLQSLTDSIESFGTRGFVDDLRTLFVEFFSTNAAKRIS